MQTAIGSRLVCGQHGVQAVTASPAAAVLSTDSRRPSRAGEAEALRGGLADLEAVEAVVVALPQANGRRGRALRVRRKASGTARGAVWLGSNPCSCCCCQQARSLLAGSAPAGAHLAAAVQEGAARGRLVVPEPGRHGGAAGARLGRLGAEGRVGGALHNACVCVCWGQQD
jgi:hypothetical protein